MHFWIFPPSGDGLIIALLTKTHIHPFWCHGLNWKWAKSFGEISRLAITLTCFFLACQGKEWTKSSYYKSLTLSWRKDRWTLAAGWPIVLLLSFQEKRAGQTDQRVKTEIVPWSRKMHNYSLTHTKYHSFLSIAYIVKWLNERQENICKLNQRAL